MEYTLLFFLGLIVGGIGVWLLLRVRNQQAYNQTKLEAVKQARAEAEANRATLVERLQGKEGQLQDLRAALKEKDAQLVNLQIANTHLQTRHAEFETKLQEAQKGMEEKRALLEEAEQKLLHTFKSLSADVLADNSQSFLILAQTVLERFQEGAKNDLEKRQLAITELVLPVKASLALFDTKVQELEKVRLSDYSSLGQQVKQMQSTQEQLRTETANLVKALRAPTVRGRWGEIQLKRVVELAGMLDHCDFSEQESVVTEEGRLKRPDLTVHLPGQKTIIVDAKAPLEAYLEALETNDDALRKAKLKEHARQIRNHITALGKKSYWSQFPNAPEFVVLFLPGEVFFSAALEHDPALIEVGANEQVILATPTTLIALLRAVVYGWKQESIAQNAQEIATLGYQLYDRLVTMIESWRKLGKNLSSAIESYNQATGSLESRVIVTARKFRDMKTVEAKDEIKELALIDRIPRELQIPEMSEVKV